MFLKKLLITIDNIVATFLPALLISAKPSIMLIFGCYSASYLTMTPVANDMSLFACLHTGMSISRGLLGRRMFLLSHSEFLMVLGKVAYYHCPFFDITFVTWLTGLLNSTLAVTILALLLICLHMQTICVHTDIMPLYLSEFSSTANPLWLWILPFAKLFSVPHHNLASAHVLLACIRCNSVQL